jgi:hypothetical protein
MTVTSRALAFLETTPGLALIALAVFLTVTVSAQQLPDEAVPAAETYDEECQSEGCDGEEVEEMHEDYESECFEESCNTEEVREIAGSRGAINAMLNDFQARGLRVSGCDFIGPCQPSPGNNVATRDTEFGAFCSQASINQHWDDFDFDREDWDNGFGYEDPCNNNLPLGRTFNALNLLDFFGTSKPDDSDNWLPWFYSFASNAHDELDAKCGSGRANGCLIAQNFRGLDDYTVLYWPFFYGQDVPSRAATIVHEARHADGSGHNGGTTCPNGGSCDSNWGYNGAITYEVLYLWWLRAQGTGVSTAARNLARTRGNALLASNFNTRPTNAAVFGAGAANPNANFSIP